MKVKRKNRRITIARKEKIEQRAIFPQLSQIVTPFIGGSDGKGSDGMYF